MYYCAEKFSSKATLAITLNHYLLLGRIFHDRG